MLHFEGKSLPALLANENAILLMMNECNYYPKKVFIHGYDYNTLHWEWNDDSVTQLLTQFFSRLESISVDFSSVEKEIRNYSHDSKYSNIGDFKKGFELVLNCCFSSPVLHSLVITTPIRDNRAEFFQHFQENSVHL